MRKVDFTNHLDKFDKTPKVEEIDKPIRYILSSSKKNLTITVKDLLTDREVLKCKTIEDRFESRLENISNHYKYGSCIVKIINDE